MKFRIALWAMSGFLVAGGWAAYFFFASKNQPIQPIVSSLARITCPISIFALRHPVSLYSVVAANIDTYTLIGLAIELLRRQFVRAK